MPERLPTKKQPWYMSVLLIVALVLLSPLILLVVLLFLIPWLQARFLRRPRLLRRVQKEWLPKGTFILFIYSDNGLWKEYAEKHIIPQIKTHAIILNWSNRKEWLRSNSLEAQLFRNFVENFEWRHAWIWHENIRTGGQDYNHMAIVFKPWNKPKVIYFWKAFKEYEFGKESALKDATGDLYHYLEEC